MTHFVDASVIVAMLAAEADARAMAIMVKRCERRIWSAMVRWEATIALARFPKFTADLAREAVLGFGHDWSMTLVPIGEREDAIAFEAYRTYGKGSCHPARLNMGDCFAYACAKANDARLLYKGDDFAMTDLA